jgi:hypothetical protein
VVQILCRKGRHGLWQKRRWSAQHCPRGNRCRPPGSLQVRFLSRIKCKQ